MRRAINDVTVFHLACDVPVMLVPEIPPDDRKQLRIRLITEEVVKELLPALEDNNMGKIADGIADGIYVLIGCALEYGIPLGRIWDAVQEANMAKVDAETGKVIHSDGTDGFPKGKVLKPFGWTEPPIDLILANYGYKPAE